MIFNQRFARLAVSNAQCSVMIRFFSIIVFYSLFCCSLNDFEARHIPVLLLELEKKLLQNFIWGSTKDTRMNEKNFHQKFSVRNKN